MKKFWSIDLPVICAWCEFMWGVTADLEFALQLFLFCLVMWVFWTWVWNRTGGYSG